MERQNKRVLKDVHVNEVDYHSWFVSQMQKAKKNNPKEHDFKNDFNLKRLHYGEISQCH